MLYSIMNTWPTPALVSLSYSISCTKKKGQACMQWAVYQNNITLIAWVL